MLSNASRFWLLASADILGCARKYLPNINFLVLLENFRNINQKIFDFWTKLYVRFCFVTQTEKLRMLNFVEPWHVENIYCIRAFYENWWSISEICTNCIILFGNLTCMFHYRTTAVSWSWCCMECQYINIGACGAYSREPHTNLYDGFDWCIHFRLVGILPRTSNTSL